MLRLRKVVVAGNRHTTAAQVIGAAALVPGTRLTSISSAEVIRRVDRLPWVGSAAVTHILPSEIRIVVTERKPIVVVQGQGHSYLVDATGAVLQETGVTQTAAYPLVTGLPLGLTIPGERITAGGFAPAISVLRALPAGLRARLTSIAAPSADLITVTLNDQTVIAYGDADALASKNYDVESLLANGRTYVRINVSAPAHPAAIPR